MLNPLNRCFSMLVALFAFAIITSADDALILKGADIGTFQASVTNGVAITSDVGAGESTHLGRYTLQAGEHIQLSTLEITDGHFIMTASNGDTLTGSYSGSGHYLTPAHTFVEYEVSGPITGGTGRFLDATGILTLRGSADLVAGTFADEIFGAVTKE